MFANTGVTLAPNWRWLNTQWPPRLFFFLRFLHWWWKQN